MFFFITVDICVLQFQDLNAFGILFVRSLYKEDYLQTVKLCPFDYTSFAVSGKDGIP